MKNSLLDSMLRAASRGRSFTYREIANAMGITHESVRLIESTALAKLKAKITLERIENEKRCFNRR